MTSGTWCAGKTKPENQLPDQEENQGPENRRDDIQGNSAVISENRYKIPEYDLLHFVIWVDIEHINGAVSVKGQIQKHRGKAAGKI